MARKQYGVGVIGCGCIWKLAHLPALKEMPEEAQVRYVYDPDQSAAEEAAKEAGATVVLDPDEILEAENVDIVSVLTPPDVRVDYVKKACVAGKHLMVEKPMARTLQQALDIFSVVRETGVKCSIPLGRATDETWRKAAEIVRSGELGKPLVVIYNYFDAPYSWVSAGHWMLDEKRSGGPIFDLSIHYIDFARACLGAEAKEVRYETVATTGRVDCYDQATLMIYYEGGPVGQFTNCWAFPAGVDLSHESGFVVCRDGVLTFASEWKVYTAEGKRELESSTDAPSYRNLISAIEGTASLYADELDGLRTIEILDAAEKSRKTGRRERVCLHD